MVIFHSYVSLPVVNRPFLPSYPAKRAAGVAFLAGIIAPSRCHHQICGSDASAGRYAGEIEGNDFRVARVAVPHIF